MLYSQTVFDETYPLVPELNFPEYFQRNYSAFPSFDEMVKSGAFKGCCGGDFQQDQTMYEDTDFFGRRRNMTVVSYNTTNFKNESRMCAAALFEILPTGKLYLWNILFTTCDPFFFDNFTQPLGLLMEDTRATYNRDTGDMVLNNELPPVEMLVFFMNKIRFNKRRIEDKLLTDKFTKSDLMALALTSRNMDREFLRLILGRFADGVPTAEHVRDQQLASTAEVCVVDDIETLKAQELKALRSVVTTISPEQFHIQYIACLDALLQYPINLLPAEYKKFGRRLLMTQEDCDVWDRLVFLLILGARASLVVESPFDASLGFGSGARAFCEVSDDDERFAEKTPVDPTDKSKKIKLGDVGPNWILRTSEKVVVQQEAFLEEIKGFLAKQDYDAVILKLTEGTATPRNGQGLLGLSINLLRALMTGVIVFQADLIVKIQAMFQAYDIVWTLPMLTLQVNSGQEQTGRGIDMLFQLGAPVRALASA